MVGIADVQVEKYVAAVRLVLRDLQIGNAQVGEGCDVQSVRAERIDDHVAIAGEEPIVASATLKDVSTFAANQDVIAVTGVDDVVTFTTVDRIIACTGRYVVVAA